VGEDAGGGADKVGTAGVVGNERDDDDGGVGQGDLAGHGGPTREGRALQAEEQEDAAEEALNAAPLAQPVLGPGEREAGAVFGGLGIEGDDGGGADDGMDPCDKREPPIGGVEAHHAGAQGVEGDGGGEQGLGEGGVVAVGRGDAKEDGQAGAMAEQGVDAVAAQEGGGMMGGGVAVLGVGVGAAPGFDGGAVDDQVARAHDALADSLRDHKHEERLAGWSAGAGRALPLLGRAGHPGRAVGTDRQPTGKGERGPRPQPVGHGARREAPERAQQRDQQHRLLRIAARGTAWSCRQGRRDQAVGLLDRQATQREQMQTCHEREGVDVQGRATFDHCALVCWGRDWGRGFARNWNHGLTSLARGRDRALEVSLPHPALVRKRPQRRFNLP